MRIHACARHVYVAVFIHKQIAPLHMTHSTDTLQVPYLCETPPPRPLDGSGAVQVFADGMVPISDVKGV